VRIFVVTWNNMSAAGRAGMVAFAVGCFLFGFAGGLKQNDGPTSVEAAAPQSGVTLMQTVAVRYRDY